LFKKAVFLEIVNLSGMIMKALVTGATGFIGSHVADLLHSRGIEVVCTIRQTSNLRWLKDKPYKLVEASLSNKDSLIEAAKDVDYVVHVAGLTFARNYEEFLRGNQGGTRNLLQATIEAAPNLKRFLFVSSQTVAGPSESLDNPKTEIMEDKPLTSYAKSKLAAEGEVWKMKDKMPITIVRPPAVYGPRDTAIFDIFKTVKMGLGTLIGFKPKYLSLIHSTDLARGIVDAAMSKKTIGELYYVSSDEFYNWDQLMNLIAAGFGKKSVFKLKLPHPLVLSVAAISEFFGKFSTKPPVFNYEKGIDFIQDYWTCSTEKAKRDFGYSQQVSIEDGMKETCQWYLEQKWL
jgi:dihydroflavonol-4-reductase